MDISALPNLVPAGANVDRQSLGKRIQFPGFVGFERDGSVVEIDGKLYRGNPHGTRDLLEQVVALQASSKKEEVKKLQEEVSRLTSLEQDIKALTSLKVSQYSETFQVMVEHRLATLLKLKLPNGLGPDHAILADPANKRKLGR